MTPVSMVDVILIGVVLGIISARAYYVAMAPFKYESIWEMISAIRDGGLAIYGGIIGGFLFGGLACKWRGVPVRPCSTLPPWAFSSGRAAAAGATSSIRRPSAATPPCRGVCTAKATRAYLMSSTVTVPKGVAINPNLPVHPTFLYEEHLVLCGLLPAVPLH